MEREKKSPATEVGASAGAGANAPRPRPAPSVVDVGATDVRALDVNVELVKLVSTRNESGSPLVVRRKDVERMVKSGLWREAGPAEAIVRETRRFDQRVEDPPQPAASAAQPAAAARRRPSPSDVEVSED